MLAHEIEQRLEELKDCENIQIITTEGKGFKHPYADVVNDIK